MMVTKAPGITIVAWILLSFVLPFGQKPPSSSPNCEEYVFSDVHHVPEADDYVGTEIVLNLCSGVAEVSGSWSEYEGYNPVTTNLSGRRTKKTLRLGGENSEGKVEFIGRLEDQRLVGKLTWFIGNNRQKKNINLVRKQCPVRPPE
jgi:hypothetical protein